VGAATISSAAAQCDFGSFPLIIKGNASTTASKYGNASLAFTVLTVTRAASRKQPSLAYEFDRKIRISGEKQSA